MPTPKKPTKKPAPRKKPAPPRTALVTAPRITEEQKREAMSRLTESYDWFNGFFPDLMDRYYANGQWWFPAGSVPGFGGTANKVHGFDAYVFRTEQELRLQRDHARILFAREPIAQAIVRHMKSFVVNRGWSYNVTPKAEHAESVNENEIAKAQQLLTDWMEREQWKLRERELFECWFVDGEFFLRTMVSGGELTCRRYEPEHITDPAGATRQNGWFMGVHCEPMDAEVVKEYHYKLPYAENGELIPAKDMIHGKANTTRNVTRGISFLFSMFDDIDGAGKLMDCIRQGAMGRAEIAYILTHKNGTTDAVNTFADQWQDYSRTHPTTGKTQRTATAKPGRIVNFSDVTNATTMPSGDSEGNIMALQAQLRQIYNTFGMPEFMSGDASNNNYASSQMAGSPMVRGVEGMQEELTPHFKGLAMQVLTHEAAKGNLSPKTLAMLEVLPVPPSPVMEDELQKAQCHQIYVEMGAKSVQGVTQEIGEDVEKVQQERDEWLEANAEQMAAQNGEGGPADVDGELDALEGAMSDSNEDSDV
jgi:hypothetical protein